MKPSSGRARSAATLAATAFFGVAVMVLAGPAAHAQTLPPTDGTPQVDASIAQKDWSGALKQLDARIASNPRNAQAKFKRATVLARLNRDDEAITAFTELTQMYPELPEPYNNQNLGDLYLRLAAESYKRAQGMGHASGTTQQRLADIQKIVSPPKTTKAVRRPAAQTTPADDYTNRATSNVTENPSFQFGGPSGSLAIPPYNAPSK